MLMDEIWRIMALVVGMGLMANPGLADIPPQPPLLPLISAYPSSLTPDGISTSIITAEVVNETGYPQVGVNIFFNIDSNEFGNISTKHGSFNGYGWINITDGKGRGEAIFTAGIKEGEVRITVNYGNYYNYTIIKVEDKISPQISEVYASPQEILLREPGNGDSLHTDTVLSATVMDAGGLKSVTIDLSSIGGSAQTVMNSSGWDMYTTITKATGSPGTKSLKVNATDNFGNSNKTVSIQLKVTRNGDVNGDGKVDIRDVVLLRNSITFRDPRYALNSMLAAEVTGEGAINIQDVLRLRNSIAFPGDMRFILK